MKKNIFKLALVAILFSSCAQKIRLRTGLSELTAERIIPKELKADIKITSNIKDGEIPVYDWKMEESGMFDKYEYRKLRVL